MNISVTKNNGDGVVHMHGRFDFNTHRAFKEACDQLLQDGEISRIDINLAGVEYLDSSALGMLLVLRERVSEKGKALTLVGPGPMVSQVLDIANFGKLFTIR